jgi:hypothetical protein
MIEPSDDDAIQVYHCIGAIVESQQFPSVNPMVPRTDNHAGLPGLRRRSVLLHAQIIHRRAREVGVEPACDR